MSSWTENDALFFQELRKGRKYEEMICRWLNRHGLRAVLFPRFQRDHYDANGPHQLSADMRVGGFRIDTKSRAEKFTTPCDFPFPTIFVGTERKIKAQREAGCMPDMFICISQVTRVPIGLPSEYLMGPLEIRNGFDHVRQIAETWVIKPRRCWLDGWQILEWIHAHPRTQ